MKPIDITGHRYERLTVVGMDGRKSGRPLWRCRCDCGNEIAVLSNALRQGNTTSCGCFKIERARIWGQANRTHGESKCGSDDGQPSREYRTWSGMRERCRNPQNKDFQEYGARGIKVCDRWQVYENFLADMGRCPAGHSLDRIDNEGSYSPENCRWATASQQNKNRRPLRRDDEGRFASC